MRLAIILSLLISLCACSLAQPQQIRCEPVRDFSCTVSCESDETVYTFALQVCPDNTLRAEVCTPQELAGVVFSTDGTDYTVNANGLEQHFNESAFSAKSPVRLLFESIRAFLFTGTETLTALEEDTFSARQNIGTTDVIAVFTRDGIIKSVYCPTYERTFTFSEFQVNE